MSLTRLCAYAAAAVKVIPDMVEAATSTAASPIAATARRASSRRGTVQARVRTIIDEHRLSLGTGLYKLIIILACSGCYLKNDACWN